MTAISKIYFTRPMRWWHHLWLTGVLFFGLLLTHSILPLLLVLWVLIQKWGQRHFAQISPDGVLTIYGLLHRKRWQHAISETELTYKTLRFNHEERYYLHLKHIPTQHQKTIRLNDCEYQGFGLLMDLNQLTATPFFSPIEQHCHLESLNWKNAHHRAN